MAMREEDAATTAAIVYAVPRGWIFVEGRQSIYLTECRSARGGSELSARSIPPTLPYIPTETAPRLAGEIDLNLVAEHTCKTNHRGYVSDRLLNGLCDGFHGPADEKTAIRSS